MKITVKELTRTLSELDGDKQVFLCGDENVLLFVGEHHIVFDTEEIKGMSEIIIGRTKQKVMQRLLDDIEKLKAKLVIDTKMIKDLQQTIEYVREMRDD